MEIEETREGDVVVLAPHGKLDPAAEAPFERKLKEFLDGQPRFVVVDFGKVDYVSGGALRALLLTQRRLTPRGGRLVLCRLNDVVHQAFAISGFDRVFVMMPSRAEAVAEAAPAGEYAAATPAAQAADSAEARRARIAAVAIPLLAGDAAPTAAFAPDPAPLRAGLGERVRPLLVGPAA